MKIGNNIEAVFFGKTIRVVSDDLHEQFDAIPRDQVEYFLGRRQQNLGRFIRSVVIIDFQDKREEML